MLWETVDIPPGSRPGRISYAGGLFFACGWNTFIVSSDGTNWNAASFPGLTSSDSLLGVAFGNGVYVAGGGSSGSGNPVLLAVSGDGQNWTRVVVDADSKPVEHVSFGNGTFTTGRLTSPDGLTWMRSDLTTAPTQIAFGNGSFVGVGGPHLTGKLLRSTDGIHWAIHDGFADNPTSGRAEFGAVAFGNGVFVASSYGNVSRSADSVSWVPNNPDARFATPEQEFLPSVTYGSGRYVAVGQSGAIYYSEPDGLWKKAESGTHGYLPRVAYGNGIFVTVAGPGDGIMTEFAVLRSVDGRQWTVNYPGLVCNPQGVFFLNGRFVAPVYDLVTGNSSLLTSNDALTWAVQAQLEPPNIYFQDMFFANGIYLAAGWFGVHTSPDLVSWTLRAQPPSSCCGGGPPVMGALTFGDGLFIAGADTGQILRSSDAINWVDCGLMEYGSANMGLGDAAFLLGNFFVTGHWSYLLRSNDGFNWTRNTSMAPFGLCAGPDRIVAVGAFGSIHELILGPEIISVTPDSARAKTGQDTLILVTGRNFGSEAKLLINGQERPTTVHNRFQLTATIWASDLDIEADLTAIAVSVLNPGGEKSSPVPFVVRGQHVLSSQSAIVAEAGVASLSTAPTVAGTSGISATFTNAEGTSTATLSLANYVQNPAPGTAFEIAGDFLDLQVTGADPGDSMTAYFYYPPGVEEAALGLKYFNGTMWEDVLSSGAIAPAMNTNDNLDATLSGGRFTVTFDETSVPPITALSGTYFAQALQAPISFTGFLPPIGGADSTGGSFSKPLRTIKMGSTIPVKFTGISNGEPLVSGLHRLRIVKHSDATTSGTPIDPTPTDAATNGSLFRFSNGEWHFNLDTKAAGMSVGIWQIIVRLADGSEHKVWIQLK